MNEPYYYLATKLEKGYVMVRDYNLNECFNNNCNLVIKHGKKEMLVPHSELKDRALKLDKRKFPSQFNGKEYGIYHFKWNPDNISNDKQTTIFDAMEMVDD